MQCRAWDKQLTRDNYPTLYSKQPLSPFFHHRMPLSHLKYTGAVQTSCVPKKSVPFELLRTVDDLVLKLTETGVTFLGKRNADTNKMEPTGSFKKRYTGGESCAVDINGRLWMDGKELAYESQKPDQPKKKKATPMPRSGQFIHVAPGGEAGQISDNLGNDENISENLDKKFKKKSYKIDKVKVRRKILSYLNTQKGKKHLYFWTVSFPEGTPDSVCYQAFNTWLTALRQRKMLKDYLWVAERQMGERLVEDKPPTYTIHFHIAIPHFMNVQRANAMMRGTLKGLAKKGLMPGAVCSRSGKTVTHSYLPCIAKYNGVDISKNRKTGRVVNFAIKKGSVALANYLTKYVTKNESEFQHLASHNSRGFSCLFHGVTCTIQEFNRMGFGGYLNRVRIFEMNFATFIPWLYGPPHAVMKHLYDLNSLIQTINDERKQ